jgi:hypothetical protein
MLNPIRDTCIIFDVLVVRFGFENSESLEDLRFKLSYYLAVLIDVNLFKHF